VPALPVDAADVPLPLPTTDNLVDRVIGGLASPIAGLASGGSSTGLQTLLGSLRSGLSGTGLVGDDVGDQLAFTGSSTPFLVWLQMALISAGVILRTLAKSLAVA
jgi:hypothetical protein